MCGILGAFVTNDILKVKENLFRIYKHQESRGREGFGFAVNDNGEISRKRYKIENGIFKDSMFKHDIEKDTSVIIHHRLPTSTPNIAECNHPISDEDDKIFLIHNGVIANANQLKESLKEHQFETEITLCNVLKSRRKSYSVDKEKQFTDSEVLVHMLEAGLKDKDFKKPLEKIETEVSGSYSIAWFSKNDNRIHLFKNSNPLIVFKDNNDNIYFASEFPFAGEFELVKSLENGEYGTIDSKGYKTVSLIGSSGLYGSQSSYFKNFSSNLKTSNREKELEDIQGAIHELLEYYFPEKTYEESAYFFIAELAEYIHEKDTTIKRLKAMIGQKEVA